MTLRTALIFPLTRVEASREATGNPDYLHPAWDKVQSLRPDPQD